MGTDSSEKIPRLLVLGAGPAQLGLLRAARARGVFVIACDRDPGAIGFRYADRRAIVSAEDETAITRAFSGRAARGIKNIFLTEVGADEGGLAPFPVQNALTRDVRSAAQEQDRPEFMSLWAGQGVRLARRATAADLVRETVEEAEAALAAAGRTRRADA